MRVSNQSLMVGFVITLFLMQPAFSQNYSAFQPPPEPSIKPIISAPSEVDADNSRIDDRLESTLSIAMKQAAIDELNKPHTIELIFSKQITQKQIDSFLKAGGTINHIFTNVSYGWTGSIALKDIPSIPSSMGNTLLGIVESKPVEKHLDEAGRTGRVRPMVWNAGYSGDTTITIAILDTGVDGTHSDLTGRQVYWKDWTLDNHLSAGDWGHHGSHVSGIAFGTGSSAGMNPSTISYMDLGKLSSSAGSFFLSPIHVPTSVSSFNWTSNMRWVTSAGVTVQIGQVNSDSSGGWGLISGTSSGGTSPLTLTNTGISNPFPGRTNRWDSYPSKVSGGGTPEYAVQNTIGYAGVGDGYNVFRGVASGSNWAGLKVFRDDGSGTSTDISSAIDDIVSKNTTYKIKVANMSLGITGSPGIDSGLRNKVNTAASNGIVMVISAGNSGTSSAGSAGEIGDPGRAQYAITVTAVSDINQLTDYSSHGFNSPGDANAGDEDMKPDISAPGGSTRQSYIMSVDSNTGDSEDTTGAKFSDAVPNNYLNFQGTSMASPFIAGCSSLVIQALQNSGATWHFTGGTALADVLKVKMLLLMTASETNQTREAGASSNPSLNRGAKDINEGYGKVNIDAAIEAVASTYNIGNIASDSLNAADTAKKAWARKISLAVSTLTASLTVPVGADFDLYLYSSSPDTYGNPVILARSTTATTGGTEQVIYNSVSIQTAYIVVKQVSGSGLFSLSSQSSAVPVSLSTFMMEAIEE